MNSQKPAFGLTNLLISPMLCLFISWDYNDHSIEQKFVGYFRKVTFDAFFGRYASTVESEGCLLVLNGARGEKFPLDVLFFQLGVTGCSDFEEEDLWPTLLPCLNSSPYGANPRSRPDHG